DFFVDMVPSLKEEFDIGGGMSGIISPFGEYVTEPIINEEGIAYGEINLDQIVEAKHMIDSTGHYARPDVTELVLKKDSKPVVKESVTPEIIKLKKTNKN